MLECLDYKVLKSEDSILINVNNWVYPSGLSIQKISGKASISYITKALDCHYVSDVFKEYTDSTINKGDYILLTRVASEVASMRSYDLGDGQKYFNVPIQQVLGTFKNNDISLDSLEMLYNKILIEKIDTNQTGLLLSGDNNMIGKILKVGTIGLDESYNPKPLRVKQGDVVIVKDNVSTEIRLGDKDYYAVEETHVVGVISYGFSIDDITFINDSILMVPYNNPKVLNSSLLITPDINYEDLDYSDIYNRDLFQVKYVDKELKDVEVGDVLLVKRDYTNYVYLNQEKYFLLNGQKWIETKIIKEKE